MDQGVINNLKVHYRKLLLKKLLASLDDRIANRGDNAFPFTLLDALHCLSRAWSFVKPETVFGCFHHAGFVAANADFPGFLPEDIGDPNLWESLVAVSQVPADVNFAEFVGIDSNVVTSGELTDAEILHTVGIEDGSNKAGPSNTIDSSDEIDEEIKPVTPKERALVLDIFRRYSSLSGEPDVLSCFHKLEDIFYAEQLQNLKQARITDFFTGK